MPTTPADVAVSEANQIFSLMVQIKSLRAQVADLVAINGISPFGNGWNVLKTTALNTDGTLGTADGSVVPANPIDPRVYTNLARAVKQADLTNALQVIVDFNTFCNGTQVNANAARPAAINAVSLT